MDQNYILVKVPTHKTYSANSLGEFQPQTWVTGNTYYLHTRACSLNTRQEIPGSALYHSEFHEICAFGEGKPITWHTISDVGTSIGNGAYVTVVKSQYRHERWAAEKYLKKLQADWDSVLYLKKFEECSSGDYGSLVNPSNNLECLFRGLRFVLA